MLLLLSSVLEMIARRFFHARRDSVAGLAGLLTAYLIENAKDTLCRNITIYGRCRYEDKGAAIAPHLHISHPASSII